MMLNSSDDKLSAIHTIWQKTIEACERVTYWLPARDCHEQLKHRKEYISLKDKHSKYYLVAVTGGVKVGKSMVANSLSGTEFSPHGRARITDKIVAAISKDTDESVIRGFFNNHEILSINPLMESQLPPNLVLMDTPDFDSNCRANQNLAIKAVDAADLVVVVCSLEKQFTQKQRDWMQKWKDTKAFVFIYNIPKQQRQDRTDRDVENLKTQLAGFGFENAPVYIHLPNGEGNMDHLRETVFNTKRNRYEIRYNSSLRELIKRISILRESYEKISISTKEAQTYFKENFLAPVMQEIDSITGKYIVGGSASLTREAIFIAGEGIGGPLGMFIKLRQYLHSIALPFLFSGAKIRGTAGAAIMATGALAGVIARIQERYKSWREIINLVKHSHGVHQRLQKSRKIVDGYLNEARFDLSNMPHLSAEDHSDEDFKSEVMNIIQNELDVFRLPDFKLANSWPAKALWNILPMVILLYTSIQAGLAVYGGLPLGLAYYTDATILFISLLYFEFIILGLCLKRKIHGLNRGITARLISLMHSEIASLGDILDSPENLISELNKIRNQAQELNVKLCPELKKNVVIAVT